MTTCGLGRTWLAVFVVAGAIAMGCGGGDHQLPCVSQSRRSCTGANGCAGESICEGTAPTWSACRCSDSTDAGVSDGGAGPRLGASCQRDGDCPAGAFCLQNGSRQLFGGSPPAATCVAACDPISACARFEGATCVDVGDPTAAGDGGQSTSGLCFESCRVGGSATGTTVAKCHGRAQIACAPVESAAGGAGYCRPICATSGECLTGVCDPARGVCGDSVPGDPAFGLACRATPDAGAGPTSDAGADGDGLDAGDVLDATDASGTPPGETPFCGGLCVGVGGSATVCSRRCLFGSTDECAPKNGDRRRGGCLFVTKGGGIGDLGYCAELCDCNRDCTEPSFVCDAFDDAGLEAAFTRKGACTPIELVINRPLTCAN